MEIAKRNARAWEKSPQSANPPLENPTRNRNKEKSYDPSVASLRKYASMASR